MSSRTPSPPNLLSRALKGMRTTVLKLLQSELFLARCYDFSLHTHFRPILLDSAVCGLSPLRLKRPELEANY